MIAMDDSGIHVHLKTPAEIRQAIDDEIKELNYAEIKARAEYSKEMHRIEDRRYALEAMWNKTYQGSDS